MLAKNKVVDQSSWQDSDQTSPFTATSDAGFARNAARRRALATVRCA
jgi:hypothetical protein